MKRVIAGILLASSLTGGLLAQTDAVALAAQREAEENMKRLNATLAEVQTAQEQQHGELLALKAEVDKLRSDVAKANNSAANAATQEALKRLNDQILKVDESRIADNRKLYEAMDKLAKLVSERPVLPPPPAPRVEAPRSSSNGSSGTTSRSSSNSIEEGFEYIVQPNDRLDLIVKRYREEEKLKLTMKMVMDANPNVKWERLRIGQKIFIPKPKS